jgi:hypothetical protein
VTITAVRQMGILNFSPILEIDVLVMADGMPPYPATVNQTVTQMQLPSLAPGRSVVALIDPADRASVWLDLNRVH